MIRRFLRWLRPPIEPGQLWRLRGDRPDPWGGTRYKPVRVLEVRDGWVRYYLGALFPDERLPAVTFRACYRLEQQP